MNKIAHKSFLQATKGKILIGFFLACLALLMAWAVNKVALQRILTTVSLISTPNDRLKMLNNLSHRIAGLDQAQKNQALKNPGNYSYFFDESKQLKRIVDTLKTLYQNDTGQLKRLVSIQKLLNLRDKQFVEYLKVREALISNRSYTAELEKLNEMVSTRFRSADSAVLTTKTTTSTTTLAPDEQESRGFLNRLFGKKKAEVYKIISEELQIKRDTLAGLSEDSILRSMEVSLKTRAREQLIESRKFIKRETTLANANDVLTQQMLGILKEVEAEAVAQIGKNGQQAQAVVNEGIANISWIILAFFLLTGILLYFILTDISRSNSYRIALEEAKEEAEYHGKAKQRFLSNMSHEIRTPLQSILGYSQMVAQQTHPSKKELNAIYQSSAHLLQIVNEILDYNRIISGEFSFTKQSFHMLEVLAEVIAVMQPLAEQKALKLHTSFELDALNHIEGDSFRLKQILFNLLGNAVKFTLKGEISLLVDYKQNGNELHFSFQVKDTGIGFAEEDLERIFNEFEQVDSPEKQALNPTGTGLGLSIVKALVEQQGGRITATSEKGVGTVFNFFLTYTLAIAQVKPTIEKLDQTYHGTVWIVDDDQLILELCGLIFEQNQISYRSFDTASAILQAEITDDVRFVLIDMRLPDMSGLELWRILKEKMLPTIKFYAITAQVLPDEREMVLDNGFDGLIMKPFKAEEILSIFEDQPLVGLKHEIDFTEIKKMTFGDQQVLNRLINQFKADCSADSALLKNALVEKDQSTCRLIVHRLAGRIAQMGAKTLAQEMRAAEIEIANSKNSEMPTQKIKGLLVQLAALMDNIGEEH